LIAAQQKESPGREVSVSDQGSRNKVSEKLLEALALDFEAHGQDVIEKVRAERLN
jgi:hypothetical protein